MGNGVGAKIMAVRYKVKKYVNSTSTKNGYFYGRAVVTDVLGLDALAEKIQQNCSMKKSDVKGVLTEMVEVMTEALQDSKKVTIDGLGSFKMGIKSMLVEKAAEFSANNILGFHVLFQPETRKDAAGNRIKKLVSGAKAQAYGEYAKGVNDNDN